MNKDIEKYRGYVVREVKNFCESLGVNNEAEIDDYVGEGLLALVEACENFDPARGMALRTYIHSRVRWNLIKHTKQRTKGPDTIPLDTDIEDDEELMSLMETLEDKTFDGPLTHAVREELKDALSYHLGRVLPKEAEAVRLIYGLEGRNTHTVREAARFLGVSPTQVRVLRNAGLRKLGARI